MKTIIDKRFGFRPSEVDIGPMPQGETLPERRIRVAKAMAKFYEPYYGEMKKETAEKTQKS